MPLSFSNHFFHLIVCLSQRGAPVDMAFPWLMWKVQYCNEKWRCAIKQFTHRMYGILAGIWNFAPGSKSISERSTGGLMPPYRSLKYSIEWKTYSICHKFERKKRTWVATNGNYIDRRRYSCWKYPIATHPWPMRMAGRRPETNTSTRIWFHFQWRCVILEFSSYLVQSQRK